MKESKSTQSKEKYAADNVKVRNILQDVVAEAYKNAPPEIMEKYQKFYLSISDKNIKSFAGRYIFKTKTIEIVGLERKSKHIFVTCLHELAHHIDYCNRKDSDHSAEFYECYKALLYAGLRMRLFDKEDVESISDVTDRNKIKKYVEEWDPVYVDYKDSLVTIQVHNSFEIRNELKARGYHFSTISKAWEKDMNITESHKEYAYLETIIAAENISIRNASDVQINPKGKIVIGGDTYERKEELKADGFYYNTVTRKWSKSVDAEEKESALKEYREKYSECQIKFYV